jgi:DUF2919 family protein
MRPKYSLSSYDDYLCVKPPLLLWIAALFLARSIVVPIGFGLVRFAGVPADAVALLQGVWNPGALLPSAIGAAVLYAMIRRIPGAAAPVRWISTHGRILLVIAACADLIQWLVAVVSSDQPALRDPSDLLVPGFDLYFLIYLLVAQRVRDTFSDFPTVLDSASG